MMILGIALSTMIAVALVVFAIEVYMYKKHHAKRNKVREGFGRKARNADGILNHRPAA